MISKKSWRGSREKTGSDNTSLQKASDGEFLCLLYAHFCRKSIGNWQNSRRKSLQSQFWMDDESSGWMTKVPDINSADINSGL